LGSRLGVVDVDLLDPRIPKRFDGGPKPFQKPSSEGGTIMIKSDAQRERTAAQIAGFRQALDKVGWKAPGKRSAAVRGSYEGMIRHLATFRRKNEGLSPVIS
jgi:Mrp family chromosome partitioning ATPase